MLSSGCTTSTRAGISTKTLCVRSGSRSSFRSRSWSASATTAAGCSSGWRCASPRTGCTWPSPRPTGPRSTPSTRPSCTPAGSTTGRRGCARNTTRTTTEPSRSTPTATTSRPSATARPDRFLAKRAPRYFGVIFLECLQEVTVMPTPLPSNEADRLAALYELHVLDTAPESDFDDIVKLAATVCSVPMSLVSLIDIDRQWFKAKIGTDLTETPRDMSFCGHAILGRDVLVVPDTHADPRFADNPTVGQHGGVRFYAGAPLITSDGFALGTLCVLDARPRTLDNEQVQALRALARQVTSQLELRRY